MAEKESSETAISAPPRGAHRPRRKARPVYRLPNGSFIVLGPSQRKLGKARNRALAEKRRADAEEPGEEELAALLNALDEANAAALRILASMDRSHELLQGSIRELRMARNSLTGGLAAQEKEAA